MGREDVFVPDMNRESEGNGGEKEKAVQPLWQLVHGVLD